MVDIRYAEDKDFNALMGLSISFIEDAGYPFHIDGKKLRDFIWSFIMAKGNGKACIVLVDVNDQPVGMVAGVIAEPYYTSDKVATEVVWYVFPEHRGLRNSIDLLGAFEAWGEWQGAPYIQVSNIQDLDGDKVEKFYKRKGYKKTESAFLKGIL